MDETKIIEDFYGVYLLYCLNKKHSGKTYIGFTVDPNRRIKQHNRGSQAGGARKTNNKGPWKMVLIIHGFPNNIAALRFEWAWQNPEKTRRLHHVTHLKKIPRKEKVFEYNLRILSEMLRVGPWNRLPLTIRWLCDEYKKEFNIDKSPPSHMPILQGRVKSVKLKVTQEIISPSINNQQCSLCLKGISKDTSKLKCLNARCSLTCHLNCLAERFLESGEYLPIEGDCPVCRMHLLWGDLIRKMKGCSGFETNEENTEESESSDDDEELPLTQNNNEFSGEDNCCWYISSDEET